MSMFLGIFERYKQGERSLLMETVSLFFHHKHNFALPALQEGQRKDRNPKLSFTRNTLANSISPPNQVIILIS
jgi:hypothetical protein